MKRQLLAVLGTFALGCSALVGGEVPECASHDDCAILNELNGIGDSACEVYQCSLDTDRCERQARDDDRDGLVAPECADSPLAEGLAVDCNDAFAGGSEICNGRDDDCDGVIDEAYVAGDGGSITNPLPATTPSPIASFTGTDFGRIGHGTGATGFAAVRSVEGVASLLVLDGTSVSGPSTLLAARTVDLTSLTELGLEDGCHTPRMDGTIGSGTCGLDDVDLAITEENVFAAYVSPNGCTDGQLRVGYVERADLTASRVIERGPARRSNGFAGIDIDRNVTGGAPCTGASRTSGVFGAARPSVAAMERTGPRDHAVAAWIAAPFDRADCGGAPADVEVLGLHVQQDTFGDTYGWVTATNEGQPQVIGQTTGGGRPGIGVWDGTGYLIAFGEAAGVRLVFVAMADEPPMFDRTGAPDDRTGLETDPLEITDLGTVDAAQPDDVAVRFGSIRTGGIDVAIAWREGCGTGAERIRARQLFLTRAGNTIRIDDPDAFATVELTAEPAPAAGPPAIAYAFEGMLEVGIERPEGRPTGTADNDGGWYIAWEDASEPDPGPEADRHIFARRLSEADGQLLSLLGQTSLAGPGDVHRTHPILWRDPENKIHYAFFETGESVRTMTGELSCVPASE